MKFNHEMIIIQLFIDTPQTFKNNKNKLDTRIVTDEDIFQTKWEWALNKQSGKLLGGVLKISLFQSFSASLKVLFCNTGFYNKENL